MSTGTELLIGVALGFAVVYAPTIPNCVDLMTDTKFVKPRERAMFKLIFLIWCACVCASLYAIIYRLKS